ncbi:uncharacterized protein UTRI_04768 [Ustilago trichophora]|uniref:Uncharacterized protein n=1 Tax=Ustilago trichophora TaxID=86804 RepID=A0A5C3EFQ0_9BASI|nr:uncharacterized protein UTRI_04768 [Ustilago trichophora]
MDAWSSPWNDDDAQQTPSLSKQEDGFPSAVEKMTAAPFAPLSSFDTSDPWSTNVAASEPVPASLPIKRFDKDEVQETDDDGLATSTFPSHSPPSAAWGAFSSSKSDEAQPVPTASPQATSQQLHSESHATPTRQQSLSSYDPWAVNSSSTWGAEQPSPSSALPSVEPEAHSSGWGAVDSTFTPTHELEHRFSSTHIDDATLHTNPYATENVEATAGSNDKEDEAGTNLDVWAAEASSREEKARQLDREEIDKLKVDARKLISSINTEQETQASFADPSLSEAGWTDLFGSRGTQRENLHHLQTPPSALMSSSGVLRSDVMQASPVTLNQVRSSIVKTENRGVKLVSADNNAIWQRGSRPITKADWLPDSTLGDVDGPSIGKQSVGALATSSSTTSGPGWMQTSSNDARSTSGPSFLASFFKNRQASAATAAGTTDTASNPTVSQGNGGRNSFSSVEASPVMTTNAQFEPYQDTAESRYSDDPTGPDLMSLDTAVTPAAAASTRATPAPTASAQGPGLLSRWRNSGLFKSSAKKQNPSWASASLRGDDLDWLDEQESTDSKTGPYHYDDGDDSLDSFHHRNPLPPPPPRRTETPTTSSALDPFDNLFGPAVQTSLNSGASPTATSSARSSLSAPRMSGEGGMMTINTNLGRTSSIARKSAASPLQPPPQAQNKRMSIAPPPRANAASPRIASPGPGFEQQPSSDPFADFLSDAPSQQSSSATIAKLPPPIQTVKAPARGSGGGGLTADDLLFFDSL